MNIKKILPLSDPAFRKYGTVVEGYDFSALLKAFAEKTGATDHVVYEPSIAPFEELAIHQELSDGFYGGMPIQLGYCSGVNHHLGCLEYHRGSELNIMATPAVLLLAPLEKVVDGTIDTSEVEAFLVPAGTCVQLFETALHYAPVNAPGETFFRAIVVLPRGTNTARPVRADKNTEDRLLWARNKWLIAHADSDEAREGAFVGLTGEDITA